MPEAAHRLLVSCDDRPGIVAAISGFLAGSGANIVASDQHSTADEQGGSGRFFMRTEFTLPLDEDGLATFEGALGEAARSPWDHLDPLPRRAPEADRGAGLPRGALPDGAALAAAAR